MKYVYQGAIHIHTTYSDGTGTIKEAAKAAKKAGLSWIVITDHNNLDGLSEEGWYDGVAVIVGEEISPDPSDHYIALNIKESIDGDKFSPENFINEVEKQGGIGFIAHPDESLTRKYDQRPLRWTNWDIKGFDGLEIWNFMSDWVDNYDPKTPLYAYFQKNCILTGPTKNVLDWWDRLNNEKAEIVPAIGGIDVHAFNYNFWGLNLKVFPYSDTFKTITNYLYLDSELSKDFDEAKGQIINGIKNGKNIIVNRYWNSKKENPVFYITNEQEYIFPGESIKFSQDLKAFVKLAKNAVIRLIYDGQLIWEYEGKELTFDKLDRGKYRVEIYYKNYPWVFTNPISVLD